MKYLLEYSNYTPDPNRIDYWMDILNDRYEITIQKSVYKTYKGVEIEDKFYILDIVGKEKIKWKMYHDISYEYDGAESDKPSLLKAIKNWINENFNISI